MQITPTNKTLSGTCLKASLCATPVEMQELLGATKGLDWVGERYGEVYHIYLHDIIKFNPTEFYRFSIGAFDDKVAQTIQEILVLELAQLRNSKS